MSDIIKQIEDAQKKSVLPEFRVGDTVRVHGKIKEGNRERIQVFDTVRVHGKIKEGNRERIQVFEGVVIKRQGTGVRQTFTVRKMSNGVGVEKTWPLHSPNVADVQVVRRGKVRRAKLFYLRERTGKRAKVKEVIRFFIIGENA